jgi:hypothetical protein
VHLTIEKLINKHKIVLHSFLIKLSKVPSSESNQPVQELEYQGRIGVALRNRDQVDVLMFDMAEGCAS